MRLDDLLSVLREEFSQSADDVDEALGTWMAGAPEDAPAAGEALGTTFGRLAEVSRMLGLEGHALIVEQLRDSAQVLALSDADVQAEGLGWLAMWRETATAIFERPADASAARAMVDHLAMGPMAPSPEVLEHWYVLLCAPPVLPEDAREAPDLAQVQDDDVSIEVPDDVDAGLLETFVADAPDQLAVLGDTVRELARGRVDPARVVEAQRVAHTFKGSGNIIGIRGVGRIAHRIEDLLEFAVAQSGSLPVPMARDLERAASTLDQMVYALRGEEQVPTEARQHLQALVDWVRAIGDDTWPARVEACADGASPSSMPASSGPDKAAPAAASPPTGAAEGDAQVRVSAARLDALVRRAGQQLVAHAGLSERVRRVDERLAAMAVAYEGMVGRLRELQAQIDRQGVNLQEKSASHGGFDPLEMDRYNELQAMTRFVAESLGDIDDLRRGAREEAHATALELTDQARSLKQQHGELMHARLVPFRHVASRLRRNVSQTASATGKQVRLVIEGEQTQLDSDVLDRLTEPLLHLLRNAVDHGIETPDQRELLGKPGEGTVTLSVRRDGQTVHVDCRDDGSGLDLSAIHAKALDLGLIAGDADLTDDDLARLILLPGFSTRAAVTDVSGRGVGLDVVAERLRAMKGHLAIATAAFEGTTFVLQVPATVGAMHALVVEIGGQRFALPTESVVTGLAAGQAELDDDGHLHMGERRWRVSSLATLLGLPELDDIAAQRPAVVVRSGREEVAVWVDRVVEARELILQDVGAMLQRLRGISSGALRADGQVMFMLDPQALASAGVAVSDEAARALRQRLRVERRRALVVDDSLSMRKTLSQLLTDAGYDVRTARDGFDAIEQLTREKPDVVLTDLEMPNLNGLDLTRRLRESPQWNALPVVMVTSRSTEKHRASARQVGVSAYLTKPYTDDDLLSQVRELLAA